MCSLSATFLFGYTTHVDHPGFIFLSSSELPYLLMHVGRKSVDLKHHIVLYQNQTQGQLVKGARNRSEAPQLKYAQYGSRFYALLRSSIRGSIRNPEEWKNRRLTCPPQWGCGEIPGLVSRVLIEGESRDSSGGHGIAPAMLEDRRSCAEALVRQ